MARDFRTLKDNLEIYFFNSQEKMIREVEDYIALHPSEADTINEYATSDSKIQSKPDFYGYNRNSGLSIAEQYSYDQLKIFSDLPLLSQAIEKFDIIKR
jgi:hypothetical protein